VFAKKFLEDQTGLAARGQKMSLLKGAQMKNTKKDWFAVLA